jgi:hypothetical protein
MERRLEAVSGKRGPRWRRSIKSYWMGWFPCRHRRQMQKPSDGWKPAPHGPRITLYIGFQWASDADGGWVRPWVEQSRFNKSIRPLPGGDVDLVAACDTLRISPVVSATDHGSSPPGRQDGICETSWANSTALIAPGHHPAMYRDCRPHRHPNHHEQAGQELAKCSWLFYVK